MAEVGPEIDDEGSAADYRHQPPHHRTIQISRRWQRLLSVNRCACLSK